LFEFHAAQASRFVIRQPEQRGLRQKSPRLPVSNLCAHCCQPLVAFLFSNLTKFYFEFLGLFVF
jgi:hypothetical protein